MTALDRIFKNLNAGYQYGEYLVNVRYPMFTPCLSVSENGEYIRWRHYGSSANENTKQALQWLIETIFKTTPEEFEKSKLIKYGGI
jgi:hypothetical protein